MCSICLEAVGTNRLEGVAGVHTCGSGNHQFCLGCWKRWSDSCQRDNRAITCPVCRSMAGNVSAPMGALFSWLCTHTHTLTNTHTFQHPPNTNPKPCSYLPFRRRSNQNGLHYGGFDDGGRSSLAVLSKHPPQSCRRQAFKLSTKDCSFAGPTSILELEVTRHPS